ncbi:MAG: Acg family FMN-binding oxidoreductase [Gemmatimonadota bacterium]
MREEATAPWQISEDDWPSHGTDEEKLVYLLRWAILAPSSHNSQPWLFRLRDGRLEIRPDLRRSLAVVDPEDRELVMSCGAALFHLRVALRRFGHEGTVRTVTEEGRDHPLAPVRAIPDVLASVGPGGPHDPTDGELRLFRAISRRRTNRQPFDDRPVPDALQADLREAARAEGAWLEVVTADDRKGALADLIAEGDRRQGADPRFRKELAAWIHPSRSRSRDGMPGYALDMDDLASLAGPFVVRTFDWGDRQAARDRQLAEGSPVMAVLGTARDSVPAWLDAGQALDRVLLRAAADGVSASFLNQPIEEPDLRPKVRTTVDAPGPPQVVLRMGFGPEVERPTPRRPVEEVLLDGGG